MNFKEQMKNDTQFIFSSDEFDMDISLSNSDNSITITRGIVDSTIDAIEYLNIDITTDSVVVRTPSFVVTEPSTKINIYKNQLLSMDGKEYFISDYSLGTDDIYILILKKRFAYNAKN